MLHAFEQECSVMEFSTLVMLNSFTFERNWYGFTGEYILISVHVISVVLAYIIAKLYVDDVQ